jgi:hypothetical protein
MAWQLLRHYVPVILAIALAGAAAAATMSQDEHARQAAVDLARRTLAGELKIDEASVRFGSAAAVEWKDSSLGCPERGVAYTPAITPGFRVVLTAGGSEYRVHVGGGRAVVCRPPSDRPSSAASRRPDEALAGLKLAELARADLARRLKVEASAIAIDFYRPTTWPDASLGCPRPGETYAASVVNGFLIRLSLDGQTYEYHSDATGRIVSCPAR